MSHSGSSQPDLDWSQVRETIKLLTVSVAQVEGSMKAGDESVSALANSFTSIVADMKSIHQLLTEFDATERRDDALIHCEKAQQRIDGTVIAFQFYDRLQQCLQHVSDNLKGLSAIIDTPHRLYNPAEWHKFQESIRAQFTMEAEKVMFDAIHQGKSVQEALALFAQANQDSDDEEIELF